MDINGDGHLDILSGSYAADAQPMQGHFQVFWGQKGGGFAKVKTLKGDDDRPLAVTPAGRDADLDRICTRPFAADIDGDGKLDILTGNFGGTFFWFRGLGEGRFSAKSTLLKDSEGKALKVAHHSDPTLVDWDGDGDLDLLSGADDGGVSYAENVGSKTTPRFTAARTIIKGGAARRSSPYLGLTGVTAPQRSTRIAVADVNGDGRLDVIVGDCFSALLPKRAQDRAEFDRLAAARQALLNAADKDRDALIENRRELKRVARSGGAGLVWVYYRKS